MEHKSEIHTKLSIVQTAKTKSNLFSLNPLRKRWKVGVLFLQPNQENPKALSGFVGIQVYTTKTDRTVCFTAS